MLQFKRFKVYSVLVKWCHFPRIPWQLGAALSKVIFSKCTSFTHFAVLLRDH